MLSIRKMATIFFCIPPDVWVGRGIYKRLFIPSLWSLVLIPPPTQVFGAHEKRHAEGFTITHLNNVHGYSNSDTRVWRTSK